MHPYALRAKSEPGSESLAATLRRHGRVLWAHSQRERIAENGDYRGQECDRVLSAVGSQRERLATLAIAGGREFGRHFAQHATEQPKRASRRIAIAEARGCESLVAT